MKKVFIIALGLFSGFSLISCSSKPTANSSPETPRIPATSDQEKLPSTFHKHGVGTEVVQTNYCWIVKIDRSVPDLQRYFITGIDTKYQLTDEDIGKYTVLGQINYNGFGGDGYAKIRDIDHKAVSYDEAVNILNTIDDCTDW